MSSSVTGSVVGYPSITMPRLSPTSSIGMPASSRMRALRKSYAVSTAKRLPSSLNRWTSSTVVTSDHTSPADVCHCPLDQWHERPGRLVLTPADLLQQAHRLGDHDVDEIGGVHRRRVIQDATLVADLLGFGADRPSQAAKLPHQRRG